MKRITDYIKELNLFIPPSDPVGVLIASHRRQRAIIYEQQKIINAIPRWIRRLFSVRTC